MSCEFAHLDGSYVLGALSPAERLEFEHHLGRCEDCSRAVRELAGIPGLLAQVELSDIEEASGAPVPPSLLPSLVREARFAERRRSAVVASVAASVAAAVVGVLAVATGLPGGREPVAGHSSSAATSATSAAPGRPMEAVRATPVRADVLLAGVAWGTRLDMTCSYGEGEDDYQGSPGAEYALVVRTRDGRTEQVATWKGLPGRTMRVSGATATDRADIQRVELRTADGLVVLQLTV